jgi:hypothetical protein
MTQVRGTTNNQGTWASGLNVIAGLWLLISPWVLGFTDTQNALWNNVILGIAIAIIAFIRAGGWYTPQWLGWLNLILGIWVFIAPFVLGYSNVSSALWDDLVLGVIVVVLSAWSLWATNETRTGVTA